MKAHRPDNHLRSAGLFLAFGGDLGLSQIHKLNSTAWRAGHAPLAGLRRTRYRGIAMPLDRDSVIRAQNRAQGLRIKRNNLIAALLSGAVLVLISVLFVAPSLAGFLCGVLAGLVYANGFEYCLHRFLLHCGRGIFAQQHMVHHATLKSPEAARYVNFSSNPWGVVALFCANAIPFFALEWIFRDGWVAGAFASFALYYMAFEEIHWRSHMGGRLPAALAPAARHHLRHHADDSGYFNVFLPLFDWIVSQLSSGSTQSRVRREIR